MPSVSPAQHRFIGYLHSHPEDPRAKRFGQERLNEWLHADKGRHYQQGGLVVPQRRPEFMRRNY